MNKRTSRAFTLVELVVALGTVIGTTTGVVILQDSLQLTDRHRDAQKLITIHKSLLISAQDGNGRYLSPARTKRLPINGVLVPGRGPENHAANDHAALYSLMVVMKYCDAQSLISPVEKNTNVRADENYDFDKYNPIEGIYWDPNFQTDLGTECNVSYATMLLRGQRLAKHWRDSQSSIHVVLGTRSDRTGKGLPNKKAITGKNVSITHRFFLPHNTWSGNLLFNDGHYEHKNQTTVNVAARYDGQSDNPLTNDDQVKGRDSFICITKGGSMSKDPEDLLGYQATWD